MYALRSAITFALGAVLFATTASALPVDAGADLAVRSSSLAARFEDITARDLPTRDLEERAKLLSLQVVLDVLKNSNAAHIANIQSIVGAASTTPTATTTSQMNAEYSSLEQGLNVALAGVTKLLGQTKGNLNLLNLGQTVTDIVADLEVALATVEAGLAMDPALAPLIATLVSILNGPLVSLLTAVTGLTSGLLPVVNGLLAGLGLAPLLASLQGTVTGLLAGLGL